MPWRPKSRPGFIVRPIARPAGRRAPDAVRQGPARSTSVDLAVVRPAVRIRHAGLAVTALLPVLLFTVAIARGPSSWVGTAPSVPVASYVRSPSSDDIARRIVDATLRLAYPGAPPFIQLPTAGSLQLAALNYPAAPPYLTAPPPKTSPVRVPALLLDLGSTSDLLPPPVQASIPSAPPAPVDPATTCVAREPTTQPASVAVSDFASSLVAAAIAQTDSVSVYQARYVRIAYPGGDVSRFYGVCTDVVIRAYRAVGIDLQLDVQKARLGRGDTSIDHRRTETLRAFFARTGETLPVTEFAEDYLPGDIVTYYRPQNRSSTAHIAIVTDVLARSGRPMIVHNRGFGVQLEDALFVDTITGHYRYRGAQQAMTVALAKSSRVPLARIALRTAQARSPQPALAVQPTAAIIPVGR